MAKQPIHLPQTVSKYRVSRALLHSTAEALRQAGEGRREAAALWQGRVVGPTIAEATKLIVPHQLTGPRHFNVPLGERLRIADEASQAGQLIVVQLHTHPEEAFHSQADDELAIIKHTGAISIVIPEFGLRWQGDLAETSVHSHLGRGRWRQLAEPEVRQLFEVSP